MSASKKQAVFRFYGSLTEFLPRTQQQADLRYAFWGRPAVKDAIEAQGGPHPEVDLIVVNGECVGFDARLSEGDRVGVYPWLRHLERPEAALRPAWPDPLRFVCDVHLGQLARDLRMLGLDALYDQGYSDPALARLSDQQTRVLLTRDVGLLKRSQVRLGAFVRAQAPARQLVEVVRRFGISDASLDPFSRCLDCNVPLEPATASTVATEVPPHARRVNEAFWQCPSCETVYWEGSHVERMRQRLRHAFKTART